MKRGLILILITLLLIPAVSATISLTGPSKTQYNIGDTLDVSGYIVQEEDLQGYLQLSVECDNQTYPLQLTAINLIGGQETQLSDLSLPEITVTSSMLGLCKLNADALASGVSIDQGSTSSFEVTKELDGTFDLDKSQIQLGDSLTFTGSVFQLDSDKIDGTLELYFEREGSEFLVGFLDIVQGEVNYEHDFISGFSGQYTTNVVVRDSYGNSQKFERVADFTVLDELHVFVNTNLESIFPGEHVNVFGEVTTLNDGAVPTGAVEIVLGEEIHSTALDNSKYTYDVFAPSDIKTGSHALRVSVRDSHGNSGSGTAYVDIKAKATVLNVGLSNETLEPGEQFKIQATLYDQAGDVMQDDVALEVYDSEGVLISERVLYSEESLPFQLSQYAKPGEWTIRAYYDDLLSEEVNILDEKKLTVSEVNQIDYYIQDGVLYIKNVGNTRYTDDIAITVEGEDQDYTIQRTKNLNVNETLSVPLAEEVPTGNYAVSVPTGYAVGDVDAVAVENGKPRKGLNWIYSLLAVVFLVALAYVIYWRVGPKRKKGREEKKKEGEQKDDVKPDGYKTVTVKKKVKKKANKEDSKKKKPSLTFEDKDKSMQDFRERTLKEIKKTQAKIDKDEGRSSGLRSGSLGYVTGKNDKQKKPAPPAGEKKEETPSVFNLFD